MKVIGYCEYGKHVRYVNTTTSALAAAAASGRVVVGICDSCKAERDSEVKR